MKNNALKAQGIMEISLIVLLTCVIALTVFTDFGSKVSNFFQMAAPSKNSENALTAYLPSLNSLFGTSNTTSLTKNISTLQNNSQMEVKSLGNKTEKLMENIALINSSNPNNKERISNEDFFSILNKMPLVETSGYPAAPGWGTETSGSIADFINLSIDNTNIDDSIKGILQSKNINLSSIDADPSGLTVQITESLTTLPPTTFNGVEFKGESINLSTQNDVTNFVNENLRTPADVNNLVNTLVLVNNISTAGHPLPTDIKDNFTSLVTSTKRALAAG